ncbi:MAG: hypothetical protein R3C01_05950 [Planctomycetaceae bacterium]
MSDTWKIERTAEWRSNDILFSVAHQPESTKLYVGSSDFKVFVWDTAEEKPQRQIFAGEGHQSYVTGMTLAGGRLVTGSYDQQLIWWDLAEQKEVRRQQAHDRWIRRVISTPDGERVISVGDDMQCKVWSSETGELLAQFSDHPEQTPHHYPSMLYAVAVSSDGKLIATGDRVGHVAIWSAETFEKVGEVEAPVFYTWDPKARRHSIGGIRSLAFSPDGQQIAVGGIGKIGNIDHLDAPSRLEIFDWKTSERRHEIEEKEKKGLVEQIIYHPDGKRLLTFGGDHKGFINLFDTEKGTLLAKTAAAAHPPPSSTHPIQTCPHRRPQHDRTLATL